MSVFMAGTSRKGRDDPTNTLSNQPTTKGHARDDPDRPNPEDVHDPHSRRDPETPGFLERIKPSTWGQWSALFMVVSLFAAIVLYVTRIYPPGYHNPHMIAHGVLIGSLPFVALYFREQGFKARAMLDTVVVKLGSPTTGLHAMVTLGKVESSPSGYRLEKEVKETTFGGFVSEWLALEDVLSEEDLSLQSKAHRDPEDPSKFELDRKFTAPTKTELHGDVYVCDASSLEYDFESREVERRTTPPDYIDESATGMLIQELEYAHAREDAARDEIDVIENQLESMKKRVEDSQHPELDTALRIVRQMQQETLAPGKRRQASEILPEEKSGVIRDIDEQVEQDMNGGSNS